MIGGRKIEYYTKRLYNSLENEKNTLTNHVYIYIYIHTPPKKRPSKNQIP